MRLWRWACDMPGTGPVICSSVQRVCIYRSIDWRFSQRKTKLFGDQFAAVVMGELVKLVTCLVLVFYEEGKNTDRFVDALHRTIIKNPVDTIKICIPSLLYVIQNNLLYVSASNLDAATNQVRSSSPTLVDSLANHLTENHFVAAI